MWTLLERRMIEVTPELAKHYLKYNTYHLQRKLKPHHIEELKNKIIDGIFRFGEVAIASFNGDQIMMNGQHVCNAIIEAKMDAPCTLERFECKTALDLSNLFRQFELEIRSIGEMIAVEADSLEVKWPTWISNIVVAAATIERSSTSRLITAGKSDRNKKRLSKEEKVLLLREYLNEGRFINEIMTNLNGGKKNYSKIIKHIRRAPIVYMMIQTSRIHQKKAREFWIRVRDGEHLTKNMPEYRLMRFLMDSQSSNAPIKYIGRRISNHEFAYRTALAWNAYITGTPTRLSYSQNKPIPPLKRPNHKLRKKEPKDA